ncbi:hypothetical protein GCM10023231_11760 [Olivibacter ginsenosidimutans]|uniref:SGNH/GDSL hydrolase family protein n=2 Tax=Olivibacter ginsenosidimutans TaxID=1176537 RepID=A0ABP9ASY3_9SPHI
MIVTGSYVPRRYRPNLPFSLGSDGFSYSRFKQADTIRNADILILGSSHAYRGYDPRIFLKSGLKVMNLGSSAQTPIQTEYLINRYLNKINPKFVIVDVYPKLFGLDGVESTTDLLSNISLDKEIIDLVDRSKDIRTYNTLIYSWYRKMFDLNNGFKEKKVTKDGNRYIPGGYVESNNVYKSDGIRKPDRYEITPKQIKAFKNVIAILKKRNIDFVIMQAPIPREKYKMVADADKVDSIFSRLGEYHNMNEVLSLPDSCFFDESHLNQKGVDKYNAYVLDLIKVKLATTAEKK